MFRRSAAIVLVLLWSGLPAGAQDKPPHSSRVELGTLHLAKRGDGVLLVQTIASTSSKDRLWGAVDVTDPDGLLVCDWLKTLEPKETYRFECPLTNPDGRKYAARVRVFRDAKLEDRELMYEPVIEVKPDRVTAAEDASADQSSVPVGTFEGIEAALPVTFKPTWYRRLDKGFSMRAYENSGDLTVSADEIVFTDGKKTVRIPQAQILSVQWEPLPRDIANHWVLVRFTNDQGQPDAAAFRDGGRMGTRGSTGPIYQAVRRLKK
jgi:hypothetical protein